MNAPESQRPIPSFFLGVRSILRRARIFYILIFSIGKTIRFGSNSYIGAESVVHPPEYLTVGRDVAIGRNFFLQANLSISDEVLISSNVSIVGNDHDFSDPTVSVYWGRRLPSCTVKIGSNCLICHGVTIVGNVTIGDGVVVGAGSVVTKDLEPNSVYAGVPAKRLRGRYL